MDPIKKRKVVSVQVIPVDASHPGDVIPQFSGPDKNTTGWGIYTRGPDGLADWVIDALSEDAAMMIGTTLAEAHGVPIEAQPWKKKNEDCAAGIHSWVHVRGKFPSDHPCLHCGEHYGTPK